MGQRLTAQQGLPSIHRDGVGICLKWGHLHNCFGVYVWGFVAHFCWVQTVNMNLTFIDDGPKIRNNLTDIGFILLLEKAYLFFLFE